MVGSAAIYREQSRKDKEDAPGEADRDLEEQHRRSHGIYEFVHSGVVVVELHVIRVSVQGNLVQLLL